eukprot:scaffold66713_cov57-Phaeocystis_antarctica.AAC.2
METQQLQPFVPSSSTKSVVTSRSSMCQSSSPHALSSTRSSRYLRLDSRGGGVGGGAAGARSVPSGTMPYFFSSSVASASTHALIA